MNEQIARTKIVPPRRRPDLYSRPRLLNLLDDLLANKLILLVAPAGYGKTCTLLDFASTTQLPVCWYAVDALDSDPHRFFAHLIAAVTQRFPTFGLAANAALQTFSAGQSTLAQFVTTVINELYDHVQEDYVLV